MARGRKPLLNDDDVITIIKEPIYNPKSKDYPLYAPLRSGMTVAQAVAAGVSRDAIMYVWKRTSKIIVGQ